MLVPLPPKVRSLLEEFTTASQGDERILDALTPQQRPSHEGIYNDSDLHGVGPYILLHHFTSSGLH